MKQNILLCMLLVAFANSYSQNNVGIGTNAPNASAALDISSTTKGLLIPRMTTAQRTAITTPAKGLIVFDTDTNSFWFFNGSVWASLEGSATLTLPYQQSVTSGSTAFDVTNLGTGGALRGLANAATGIGVYGESANGNGVKGYANNAGSIAVFGSSLAGTGVKATSFSGIALDVIGKVKISGGNTNPTNGAVLTSDATGNAVWKKNNVGFSVTDPNPNILSFPANSTTTVHLYNEEFDYGNDYTVNKGSTTDFAYSLFVAPVSGLYHFDAALGLGGGSSVDIKFPMLSINVLRVPNTFDAAQTEFSPIIRTSYGQSIVQATISKDIRLVAGDIVSLKVYHSSASAVDIWVYGAKPHFGCHLIFED